MSNFDIAVEGTGAAARRPGTESGAPAAAGRFEEALRRSDRFGGGRLHRRLDVPAARPLPAAGRRQTLRVALPSPLSSPRGIVTKSL